MATLELHHIILDISYRAIQSKWNNTKEELESIMKSHILTFSDDKKQLYKEVLETQYGMICACIKDLVYYANSYQYETVHKYMKQQNKSKFTEG